MEEFIKKFIEFKVVKDPSGIKWDDVVAWKDGDNFLYIESKEINYVSWSFGILSVIPSSQSILSTYFNAIIIQSSFILVGKNIKTGN